MVANRVLHPPLSPLPSGLLPWRWDRLQLAYFVLVPIIIAVFAAISHRSLMQVTGYLAGIGLYIAHAVLAWWATCLSTAGWMRLLQRWKPPWLALLVAGYVLACLLTQAYSNWLEHLYKAAWPELLLAGNQSLSSGETFLTVDFWIYGALWIGINLLFDRFLGLPLYRYQIPRGYDAGEPGPSQVHTSKLLAEEDGADAGESAGAGTWGGLKPGFIDRLPADLKPQEVLAVKAEQHYVRVVTPNKHYMVLYRFSDALRDLREQPGHQVHRSWWVSNAAITVVNARAKGFTISLSNGEEIPVSGPYQGIVREFARISGIKLRGAGY